MRKTVALASGCALVAAVYRLRRRRRAAQPPIDVGPAAEAVARTAQGGAERDALALSLRAPTSGRSPAG